MTFSVPSFWKHRKTIPTKNNIDKIQLSHTQTVQIKQKVKDHKHTEFILAQRAIGVTLFSLKTINNFHIYLFQWKSKSFQ